MVGFKRKPSIFQKPVEEDVMSEDSESQSEPESEQESEEEGDVKLAEPSKTSIYNREGLNEQLADMSWPEKVEWIHKLTVNIDQEEKVDVNDDLARELSFYNQALVGTKIAFEKLQKMNIPFLRPSDYYAEMVKTDSHMVKVKGRLLVEKKKIEESEERRKNRESKKLAKEVQSQKLKEKSKQKKDDFENVKKWRKRRQQSGFAPGKEAEEELGLSFEDGTPKTYGKSKGKRPGVRPGDRSGGMARAGGGYKGGKKGGGGNDKVRNSRERRDSKFGFGGKKGMNKQNTAATTDDFRGFNQGESAGKKRRKF